MTALMVFAFLIFVFRSSSTLPSEAAASTLPFCGSVFSISTCGSAEARAALLELVGLFLGIDVAVQLDELEDHAVLRALLGHGVDVGRLLAGNAIVHADQRLADRPFDALAHAAGHLDDGLVALGANDLRLVERDLRLGGDALEGLVVDDGRALDAPDVAGHRLAELRQALRQFSCRSYSSSILTFTGARNPVHALLQSPIRQARSLFVLYQISPFRSTSERIASAPINHLFSIS